MLKRCARLTRGDSIIFKFSQELSFVNFANWIDSFLLIFVGTNFRKIVQNSRNERNFIPAKINSLRVIQYYKIHYNIRKLLLRDAVAVELPQFIFSQTQKTCFALRYLRLFVLKVRQKSTNKTSLNIYLEYLYLLKYLSIYIYLSIVA